MIAGFSEHVGRRLAYSCDGKRLDLHAHSVHLASFKPLCLGVDQVWPSLEKRETGEGREKESRERREKEDHRREVGRGNIKRDDDRE